MLRLLVSKICGIKHFFTLSFHLCSLYISIMHLEGMLCIFVSKYARSVSY